MLEAAVKSQEAALVEVILAAAKQLDLIGVDATSAALRQLEESRRNALARLNSAADAARSAFSQLAGDTQDVAKQLRHDLFAAPARQQHPAAESAVTADSPAPAPVASPALDPAPAKAPESQVAAAQPQQQPEPAFDLTPPAAAQVEQQQQPAAAEAPVVTVAANAPIEQPRQQQGPEQQAQAPKEQADAGSPDAGQQQPPAKATARRASRKRPS